MSLFQQLRSVLGGSRQATHLTRVDQVAPWLFIGPELSAPQYADLRARGVTHVVDLRLEGSDDPAALDLMGLRWRRLPIADRDAPTDAQLAELVQWLDREAEAARDPALYVHCHAGLGRTPTVAIALLMQHDLSLQEAHRLVAAARPEVQPTSRQLTWLRALEAQRRGPPRGAIPPRQGSPDAGPPR
jgi:protein-tyrosine phosphatase